MSIATWSDSVTDQLGRGLPNTRITVYADQALTALAAVYTDPGGAVAVAGSVLTTDAYGNLTVHAAGGVSLWGLVTGQQLPFEIAVPGGGGSAAPVPQVVATSQALSAGVWLADAGAGPLALTLPPLGGGLIVQVKKVDPSPNAVTLLGPVDDAGSAVLSVQYAAFALVAGAAQWSIF